MSNFDEDKLIEQLSNPTLQRQAFELIVRQYSEQLYWRIRRFVFDHDDADDVLQNVYLKAWKNLADFKGNSKVSTWLYRIAINESLDFLRKKKTSSIVSTDVDTGTANLLLADDYFDGDRSQALLYEAVAQLPGVQRTVFNMRYFDNMKYSEISKVLETSEGALKASYHIAVQKVSEYVKSRQ